MRDLGLVARRRRRFVRTTQSNASHPVAPNVLHRDFTASAPNECWVTDITYVRTDEGWACIAAILDLYSRPVVGWALADSRPAWLSLRCETPCSVVGLPRASFITPTEAANTPAASTATGFVDGVPRGERDLGSRRPIFFRCCV